MKHHAMALTALLSIAASAHALRAHAQTPPEEPTVVTASPPPPPALPPPTQTQTLGPVALEPIAPRADAGSTAELTVLRTELLAPVLPVDPEFARMAGVLTQFSREQRLDLAGTLLISSTSLGLLAIAGGVIVGQAVFTPHIDPTLQGIDLGGGIAIGLLATLGIVTTLVTGSVTQLDGDLLALRLSLSGSRGGTANATAQSAYLLEHLAASSRPSRRGQGLSNILLGSTTIVAGGALAGVTALVTPLPATTLTVGAVLGVEGILLIVNGVRLLTSESPADHAVRTWRSRARPDAGIFNPVLAPSFGPGGGGLSLRHTF